MAAHDQIGEAAHTMTARTADSEVPRRSLSPAFPSLSATSRPTCFWINVRTVRCEWPTRGSLRLLPEVLVDATPGR